MKRVYIITGTSSGLGKSFVDILYIKEKTVIISISRKLHEDHIKISKKKLIHIPTDLSNCDVGILLKKINNLSIDNSEIIFINNAFAIQPIIKIEQLEKQQILDNLKTNIIFPVEFISSIIKNYKRHSIKIINITSGAASRPIENWSLYCSCKSFLNMFFKVLELENSNELKIYNIEPGVMDTKMQQVIRESDFPNNEYFVNLQYEKKLKSPTDVVYEILKKIEL